MDFVKTILNEYSPDAYSGRINGFVQEQYIETRLQANLLKNWYVIASGAIKHWVYNIILILLFPYFRKQLKDNRTLINIYIYTLLLSSVANLMSLIPSGGRFQILTQMFKIPLFLITIISFNQTEWISKYMNIALFLLILPLIFEIRKIMDFYSITLLGGNFITTFFWENNIPLINYIKMII